jgi:hypothetical protein
MLSVRLREELILRGVGRFGIYIYPMFDAFILDDLILRTYLSIIISLLICRESHFPYQFLAPPTTRKYVELSFQRSDHVPACVSNFVDLVDRLQTWRLLLYEL